MRSPDALLALGAALWVGGCGRPDAAPPSAPTAAAAEAHAHEEGPHGGALAPLDAGAWAVEVVHDAEKGAIRLFVYGPDEKTPAPAQAAVVNLVRGPAQVVLAPASPGGGGSAEWTGTHEALRAEPLEGRVRLLLGGKTCHAPLAADEHGHEAR